VSDISIKATTVAHGLKMNESAVFSQYLIYPVFFVFVLAILPACLRQEG
jgi:hypothetical protein